MSDRIAEIRQRVVVESLPPREDDIPWLLNLVERQTKLLGQWYAWQQDHNGFHDLYKIVRATDKLLREISQ